MRLHRATSENSPQPWDEMVAADPSGHLLQTWGWGELKRVAGWRAERWYVEEAGQPLCGAQVLFQRRGPLQFGYIPKGPFIVQHNPAALRMLWQRLDLRCRLRLVVSLKVEPEWEADDPAGLAMLAEQGFTANVITVQPRRTIIVSLDGTEEELLARMKSKWRYNVRLAGKHGVSVQEAGSAGLPAFYKLLQTTGERDQFAIHSLEYYQQAFASFERNQQVQLLTAEYNGQLLAGLMVFMFNRQAWYLYGASANEHRELMVNHLLQWSAMLWAKQRACRQYDLWGIADTEGDADDPLSGVEKFKSGFGGRVVRYVGAYDKVYIKPAYRLWERYYRSRKAASSG